MLSTVEFSSTSSGYAGGLFPRTRRRKDSNPDEPGWSRLCLPLHHSDSSVFFCLERLLSARTSLRRSRPLVLGPVGGSSFLSCVALHHGLLVEGDRSAGVARGSIAQPQHDVLQLLGCCPEHRQLLQLGGSSGACHTALASRKGVHSRVARPYEKNRTPTQGCAQGPFLKIFYSQTIPSLSPSRYQAYSGSWPR